MKLAAVHAIADLAKQPVPDVVNDVYKVNNLSFGRNYFIPKPVDPRLITEVSSLLWQRLPLRVAWHVRK